MVGKTAHKPWESAPRTRCLCILTPVIHQKLSTQPARNELLPILLQAAKGAVRGTRVTGCHGPRIERHLCFGGQDEECCLALGGSCNGQILFNTPGDPPPPPTHTLTGGYTGCTHNTPFIYVTALPPHKMAFISPCGHPVRSITMWQ